MYVLLTELPGYLYPTCVAMHSKRDELTRMIVLADTMGKRLSPHSASEMNELLYIGELEEGKQLTTAKLEYSYIRQRQRCNRTNTWNWITVMVRHIYTPTNYKDYLAAADFAEAERTLEAMNQLDS